MSTQAAVERIADIIGAGLPTELAHKDALQILAEFIVIPRSDIPQVGDLSRNLVVIGHGVHVPKDVSAYEMRRMAYGHLAVAEYLEAAKSAAAAAAEKLKQRRDEIANSLVEDGVGQYEYCTPLAQRAIDRIIELEYEAGHE